jgi:uncharacterized protein (TIGR02996 family)
MAGRWFAKRFPRRLPATAADLARMAWNPSYRAPHPSELLDPDPFVPPGPPPMTPYERGLLDAVLADPDADEPRLRYAEWYDRQGDERGEFIRLQIDQTKRTGGVSPPSERPRLADSSSGGLRPPLAVLTDRELNLLTQHSARWCAPFEPWSARDVVFRRGFAEAMSLAGRAFISLGDGLFRTTPLWDVRLVAVAPFLDELARTPHLAKLDRLDLSGNWIGPAGVRELARSPHLTRLQALDLSRNGLGPDGVRELLAAPWRGQLRSLALADNGLTAAEVDQLLADPALAGLTDLDVSANDLGGEVAEKLRQRFGSGLLLR